MHLRLIVHTTSLLLITAVAALYGLLFAVDAGAAAGSNKSVLVLDVSNSMWGRMEKREKILIAREVVGEMLDDWDPQIELGVIAYGHRRKGDCADIETVVPVGPADTDQIRATVNRLTPRGKTPLTAAVVLAAKELGYTMDKATVILITDGKETCDMDPCAVGTELETKGADFTAHVIGFDIDEEERAGLRCLADATGGGYYDAKRADELRAALGKVVKDIQTARSVPDTVSVSLSAGGSSFTDPNLSWRITSPAAARATARGDSLTLPDAPGQYDIVVEFEGLQRQARIEVVAGRHQQHTVVLDAGKLIVRAAVASALGAVENPKASWSIKHGEGTFSIEPFQASERALYAASGLYSVSATFAGQTLQQAVSLLPGEEQVVEIQFSIEAAGLDIPATAPMSRPLAVGWNGPGDNGDFIAVAEPSQGPPQFIYSSEVEKGNPVEVVMPDRPGIFEVRYVSARLGKILARSTIEITEIGVTLAPPPRATTDDTIQVPWTGPDGLGDYIAVAPAGAPVGTQLHRAATEDGSPVSMRMPADPGHYEIRYVSGDSGRLLGRRLIDVTEASALLRAPGRAEVNSSIDVAWEGPDNENDLVTVVVADAVVGQRGLFQRTRSGNPIVLTMPAEPGTYELRYISGRSSNVLATHRIEVEDFEVSLSAPDSAGAGARIAVVWAGPGEESDYITVVPRDAGDDVQGKPENISGGNPLDISLPGEPGMYEVRYVYGAAQRVLSRRAIEVRAVGATLLAPASAEPGQTIEIRWQGPGGKHDSITVVRRGRADNEYGESVYTHSGNPATLVLPEKSGIFELRYISGRTSEVLARETIEILDLSSNLTALDEANPGDQVEIQWAGPIEKNDYITVVPPDLPDEKNDRYVYATAAELLRVPAPDAPGAYEIRYVAGESGRVLARRNLQVIPVRASLNAAAAVVAGRPAEIHWQGPGRENDYITVVYANTPDRGQGARVYTRDGNPATLTMPDKPGAYEIRYVSAYSNTVAARRAVQVEKSATRIDTLKLVAVEDVLRVGWTGPGATDDRIVVADPSGEYIVSARPAVTPLSLTMPDTPGSYEIRYLAGSQQQIMARFPLRVVSEAEYEKRLAREAPSLVTLEAIDAISGDSVEQGLTWTVRGIDGRNGTGRTSQTARASFWLPIGAYEVDLSHAGMSQSMHLFVNPGEVQNHTLKLVK